MALSALSALRVSSARDAAVSALERARGRAAALPVTPARVADAAVSAHFARVRRRAASDPTWAAIEARRQNDRGTITMLSDDLSMADWEEQDRIEERLTPRPWWLDPALELRHWNTRRVLSQVRHAHQRVRRGWADADVYNAGFHLAVITADMLEHLAGTAHGWPQSAGFDTFEAWTGALRANAAALRRLNGSPEADAARDEWRALASDRDVPDGAASAALERLHALELADQRAAIDAMRWVAEHLPDLWD